MMCMLSVYFFSEYTHAHAHIIMRQYLLKKFKVELLLYFCTKLAKIGFVGSLGTKLWFEGMQFLNLENWFDLRKLGLIWGVRTQDSFWSRFLNFWFWALGIPRNLKMGPQLNILKLCLLVEIRCLPLVSSLSSCGNLVFTFLKYMKVFGRFQDTF